MKCPGQDTQYWGKDSIFDVPCPKCHAAVEFYKDDTTRKCPACGHRFVNPKMDFGCAAYCQFAKQCIGTLPEEAVTQRENLFREKLAAAVKRSFNNDSNTIVKVSRIVHYCELLAANAVSLNMGVLLISSYLLPIARIPALGMASVNDQLQSLQAEQTVIDAVIELLEVLLQEGPYERQEAKILADSEKLYKLEIVLKNEARDESIKLDNNFFTDQGKAMAEKLISNH